MMGNDSMSKGDRQAMMQSMMEQFGNMGADEKKDMCASMMSMMSGATGDGSGKMPEMMSKMMHGSSGKEGSQMPEMMLTTMMPNCMGRMLSAIEPDRRGEVAAGLLSAIVEKGTDGLSDEQKQSFWGSLDDVMSRRTSSGSNAMGDRKS